MNTITDKRPKFIGRERELRELFTWLSLVMSLVVSCFELSFFSHEMSWMRSGTELNQFMRIFPTYFGVIRRVILYTFVGRCMKIKDLTAT